MVLNFMPHLQHGWMMQKHLWPKEISAGVTAAFCQGWMRIPGNVINIVGIRKVPCTGHAIFSFQDFQCF